MIIGWREIDRCVSHSRHIETGGTIAQAVLSHTLSELSFSMHSRYKEIQRLNKSNVSSDNKEATTRLVNILSVILAASQLALLDKHCVTSGIQDFHINKMRVQYFDEIFNSYESSRSPIKQSGLDPEEIKQQLETKIQLDRRNAVFLTEMTLKNITSGLTEDECHANLDSTHIWFDITILSIASPREQATREYGKESGNLIKISSFFFVILIFHLFIRFR